MAMQRVGFLGLFLYSGGYDCFDLSKENGHISTMEGIHSIRLSLWRGYPRLSPLLLLGRMSIMGGFGSQVPRGRPSGFGLQVEEVAVAVERGVSRSRWTALGSTPASLARTTPSSLQNRPLQ